MVDPKGIQTRLLDLVESEREPYQAAEENSDISESDSSDSSDSTLDMRHSNYQIDSSNNCENNHFCIEKLDNSVQKLDMNKETSGLTYFRVESPASLESPVTQHIEFPFVVTSTGTKFYRCPFYIEGCTIQNIHPEEIELHIKYKHPQDESQGENFSYMHTTMYNQTILLNSVIPRSKIRIGS
jgi:hypothetical protein